MALGSLLIYLLAIYVSGLAFFKCSSCFFAKCQGTFQLTGMLVSVILLGFCSPSRCVAGPEGWFRAELSAESTFSPVVLTSAACQ